MKWISFRHDIQLSNGTGLSSIGYLCVVYGSIESGIRLAGNSAGQKQHETLLLTKLKKARAVLPQIATGSRQISKLTFYDQRESLGSTTGHEILVGAMD